MPANSRGNQPKKPAQQRRPAQKPQKFRAPQQPRYAQPTTNIPLAQATTTFNTQRLNNVVNETIDEIIGFIEVGPTTPKGTLYSFELDPTRMPTSSRMATMGALYTKYRVRSGKFRVASNMATSVSGDLTLGFSDNPDYAIMPGSDNAVYQLPGGQITQYYTPAECKVKINDPAKWFNVDVDSIERMQCSAGTFYAMTGNPPSITGVQQIPVLFQGIVEFKGAAAQYQLQRQTAIQVWPAVNITSTTPPSAGTTGDVTMVPLPGEPAFPQFQQNKPYILNPGFDVYTSADGSTIKTAAAVAWFGKANTFRFFLGSGDFPTNPIQVIFNTTGTAGVNDLPRTFVESN